MLINSVAVVGLGVLFFPIVEKHGRRTALAYLTARMVEGVFLAGGAIAEIFGLPIGVMLSVPGGLSEVVVGLWLIFKGFQPAVGQVELDAHTDAVMQPTRPTT